MATSAIAGQVEATKAQGSDAITNTPSKRSSLRLPNRVGVLLRSKTKKSETSGEEQTNKKELEVPLYRRYAVFRSRTPSAREGSTTPKEEESRSVKEKDNMAGTDAVAAPEQTVEGKVDEGTSNVDESKKAEATAFPSATDDGAAIKPAEKPLPEPKDIPTRPRRLSATVTKLLNALPKSKGTADEREKGEGANSHHDGAGRRLLEKVGNIVHRKSKVVSEPAEGTKPDEDPAKDEGAPAVPPKTENESEAKPAESEGDRGVKSADDPVVEEEKRDPEAPAVPVVADDAKTQKPTAEGAKDKKSPRSVAAKATKLARRLSASGLGGVFHHKTSKNAAPPVSKGGVEAQALAPETQDDKAKPAEEKPATDEAAASPVPAPAEDTPANSDDKPSEDPTSAAATLADDGKPTKMKSKAPPTAFKSATNVARRLSTRASDLFKPKEGSEAATTTEGAPEAKEGEAASAEGLTRTTSKTPSVAAAAEKATELARKVSTRAQGALAKARAKAKGKPAQDTSKADTDAGGETNVEAETAPAATEEAKPSEGAETSAEATPAPPTDATTEAEGAKESADGEKGTDAAAPGAEGAVPKDEAHVEKDLPAPPSSFSPVTRVGNLTRRLSNRVSGLFSSGSDATTTAATETTKEAEIQLETATDDKPAAPEATTEAKDADAKAPEDASKTEATPEAAPEVVEPSTESQAARDDEATPAKADPEAQVDSTTPAATHDKALPAPPPSSMAKVGQLTRRLSSRVGSVFKAHQTPEAGAESLAEAAKKYSAANSTSPEPEGESTTKKDLEGEATAEGAPAAVAAVSEEADGAKASEEPAKEPVAPTTGGEASATIQDGVVAAGVATASPPTASAPPGAFKAAKPKLGRRLSARVGDLFKAKAPPVPAKDVEKVEGEEEKPAGGGVVAKADSVAEVKEGEVKAEESKEGSGDAKAEPESKDEEKDAKNETAEPEASSSAAAAEPAKDDNAQPESKPLPAKPSRTTRAKDAAADVGRQLSIKASAALKAQRPKLEEIASKVPSAFSSRDKGKQKEGDDAPQPSSARGSTDGGTVKDNLGKRFSKVVADGIFGPKDGAAKRSSSDGKKGPVEEEWEEVEVTAEVKEAGTPKASSSEAGAKPMEEGAAQSTKPEASLDGAKNSSNEAVEGAPSDATESKKEEATKEADAKQSTPFKASNLVSGIFKPKPKASEKALPPTDGAHSHESDSQKDSKNPASGDINGKGETRRRLGFMSKKKKDSKAATEPNESKQSEGGKDGDAVKPEKSLPEPPSKEESPVAQEDPKPAEEGDATSDKPVIVSTAA